MTTSRTDLFDNWASNYNPGENERFPFIGYDAVIEAVARLSAPAPGDTVLDIGIGTGNLAQNFVEAGCTVFGIDFSARMLEKASEQVPSTTLVQTDILAEQWPSELDRKFDIIVSGYTFHEFNDAAKVQLLQRLFEHNLQENALIIIGDIAFPTKQAEQEAEEKWRRLWDHDEFYWIADHMTDLCAKSGIALRYLQVSECSGIFVAERMLS